MTGSKVHDIGDTDPVLYGMQHGRAILYINGASGTISGNKVYDFQKSGIEVSGLTADGGASASATTSATVPNNVVTGWGPTAYIAQNGIVIRSGANATVKRTPSATSSTRRKAPRPQACCSRGRQVKARSNKFAGNEAPIDGATATPEATSGPNLRPHNTTGVSTRRPRSSCVQTCNIRQATKV